MNSQPAFFTALTSSPAVMFNWQRWLGSDFENTKPFLRPIQEPAEIYPCTDSNPCGCSHEVVHSAPGRIVAFCTCDDSSGCEKIHLQESDLIQYELDLRKLGDTISRALALESMPVERSGVVKQLWRIGRYRHCLVYFSPDELTATMAAFISTEPCLVAVATEREISSQTRELLLRAGCGVLVLDQLLQLTGPGQFTPSAGLVTAIEAALPKAPASFTKVLVGIKEEIITIRTEHQELRASKARLAEMQSKGLFEFTQKVDPKSFKILCTILAEGDGAKASRSLGLGDSTVRDALRCWKTKGPAYQVMLDLVRWRKSITGKEKVPFNPEVFHEKQQSVDYPGLLSDVLDGLVSMTEGNWEDQCTELADLLRPHARP